MRFFRGLGGPDHFHDWFTHPSNFPIERPAETFSEALAWGRSREVRMVCEGDYEESAFGSALSEAVEQLILGWVNREILTKLKGKMVHLIVLPEEKAAYELALKHGLAKRKGFWGW